MEKSMSNSLYVYIAVLSAIIFPYSFAKAISDKNFHKNLFLFVSCLVSGVLVFSVILVITTFQ